MSEPLYVDPERLSQHSRPYEAASHEWLGVVTTVAGIRARYNGAWGDDDLGNKFGPSFVEGLDAVELRAQGVSDTLGYYGEGLIESGRIYGDARDDADESTYGLLVDSQYVGGYEAPEGAVYFGVNAVEGEEAQPRLYQGVLRSEKAIPLERGQVVEGQRFEALRREQAPLLMRGQLVEGRHLTQFEPQKKGIPAEAVEGEEPGQLRPAFMSRRLLRAEVGEPALPLEARQRNSYAGMPAYEGETTEPVLRSRIPAEEVYPAYRVRGRLLEPGEEPLQEAEFRPMERLQARTMLPLEPLEGVEPLQPGEQPRFYRSVNPLEPPIESE